MTEDESDDGIPRPKLNRGGSRILQAFGRRQTKRDSISDIENLEHSRHWEKMKWSSCFILHKNSPIRKQLYAVLSHKYYDIFTLGINMIQSIKVIIMASLVF
jgi:hypothetical protein